MSMDAPGPRVGPGVLGVGAAACAACCAGPIVGFLVATGIASVLGAVAFGTAGLVTVLAIAAVHPMRRRRRVHRCPPGSGPVTVDAPHRRITATVGDSAQPPP